MATLIFSQEAGAASQTLRFHDDKLVVAKADARAAREFAIPYLDVDLDKAEGPLPRGGLAAWWGAKPRIHARYPLFAARPGREALEVWADPQAPAIVAELQTRWRQSRQRAVSVDFAADPRREIARFEVLLTRGIVSAEECAAALARIAARARASLAQYAQRPTP